MLVEITFFSDEGYPFFFCDTHTISYEQLGFVPPNIWLCEDIGSITCLDFFIAVVVQKFFL